MAIALFYAIGTAAGGLMAPALFGRLLESGSRPRVSIGYFVGAALMIGAGLIAAVIGVAAEGKSLETLSALPDVNPPGRGCRSARRPPSPPGPRPAR